MIIAKYLRLSLADGDMGRNSKEESNSIENQRLLLDNFLKRRDDLAGETTEYIDDGYTGTNFNRPGFLRMLEDAKQGKINVILVKDLSRLGRDYIGVGDYLEQVFPVLGVRFIAVNSCYDSNNYIGKTMGLDMSVTNLVNTLYSRDISKKLKSAIQTKWKRGVSTSGRFPYGYLKDEDDHAKWIIDPEAAKWVREIFDCALRGWDTGMIANHMNQLGVITPGAYRQLHSGVPSNRRVSDEEWLWNTGTVWSILRKYEYTGALVQGKCRSATVGSSRQKKTPVSEWFIVEGHHPGIVTTEEFKDAQLVIHSASYVSVGRSCGNILGGKVRCGNCGLRMSFSRTIDRYLFCAHKRMTGKYSRCFAGQYPVLNLEGMVLHALRIRLMLFENICTALENRQKENKAILPQTTKKLRQEMETLKEKRIRQYESYAGGTLSKEVYLSAKQKLTEQLEEKQKQLDALTKLYQEQEQLTQEVSHMAEESKAIGNAKGLTRSMVEAFIDTVILYDPEHIEIRFTFEDLLQKAVQTMTPNE